MLRQVDVLIVGAGTAGLTAVKEVKKLSDNFLLVDRGPLGTTCSRVGCMPSKALLQVAHDYSSLKRLSEQGIWHGEGRFDIPSALKQVRRLRDHFVAFALKEIKDLGEHFIRGEACFLGPDRMIIDGRYEVKAKSIILATGGTPLIPKEWQEFKDLIETTDSLFDLEDLPEYWAVVGMGPLGLEMGQALARFDRKVFAFDKNASIGGLKDKEIAAIALKTFREEFPIELGVDVKLSRKGSKLMVHHGALDPIWIAADQCRFFGRNAAECRASDLSSRIRRWVSSDIRCIRSPDDGRALLAGFYTRLRFRSGKTKPSKKRLVLKVDPQLY